MDKQTAIAVMDALDQRLCWTQEEYEQGVREAEAEGDEPLANPHVFDVRLDATDSDRDYERGYRVRVTPGRHDVRYVDWRTVIDVAEYSDCSIALQNNGIELA